VIPTDEHEKIAISFPVKDEFQLDVAGSKRNPGKSGQDRLYELPVVH
jgi:hypothetical protein